MYKTAVKRKLRAIKRRATPKTDLEKIKAFLKKTTHDWQETAEDKISRSLENVKEKGAEVHDYLSERPIKAMGITLASGLALGFCVGYLMNNDR